MKERRMIVFLIAVGATTAVAGGRAEGDIAMLYKDEEAEVVAHGSYDRALALWPVEYEERWVPTEYGLTHMIASGPEDGPPVFFMPGLFGDATMWYANVAQVSERYRTYCLDLVTFGGKSQPSAKPIDGVDDYVAWFSEIIEHFGYDRVALVGLSYGSWIAIAMAREIPDSISAIVMLDPSETFTRMDGGIAWRGFWDFMVFPNRRKYARFMSWLGGEYSDPDTEIWFEHMLNVIELGSVGMFDVPQHRIYVRDDLRMVSMPVLVMAGGKPILYKDPRRFAEAAAEALPHADIEIVPGTGHSLNVEKADYVNDRMVRFLSRHYQTID